MAETIKRHGVIVTLPEEGEPFPDVSEAEREHLLARLGRGSWHYHLDYKGYPGNVTIRPYRRTCGPLSSGTGSTTTSLRSCPLRPPIRPLMPPWTQRSRCLSKGASWREGSVNGMPLPSRSHKRQRKSASGGSRERNDGWTISFVRSVGHGKYPPEYTYKILGGCSGSQMAQVVACLKHIAASVRHFTPHQGKG